MREKESEVDLVMIEDTKKEVINLIELGDYIEAARGLARMVKMRNDAKQFHIYTFTLGNIVVSSSINDEGFMEGEVL